MPPTHNIKKLLQDFAIMKGDSGATSHYVRDQDKACLTNLTPYSGPSVLLPDADSIPPSQQGTLTLHHDLSRQAQVGTVLPQLRSSSLLSLGQLCDDGCDVVLNKRKLYAIKDKEVILQGFRNTTDGLWDIPVAKKQVQPDNYITPPSHAALYASNHISSPAIHHLSKK